MLSSVSGRVPDPLDLLCQVASSRRPISKSADIDQSDEEPSDVGDGDVRDVPTYCSQGTNTRSAMRQVCTTQSLE